ncbi:hypothetical protein LS72_005180 [Helicobacter apodemus]|uniref:Type IV secretion system protein n=1 Tax=Helicobacter apodemus TaxID=135569 RepID=A0A4U8UDZ7_9HELI|nr:hypothetical protein [Helicobacter apodemus]TLE15953.1 hypothetical protein LS72_005180 [Helicobacter apodemus]
MKQSIKKHINTKFFKTKCIPLIFLSSFNVVNGAGIPVVDATNLSQTIMGYVQDGLAQAKDYALQMQQYTQMVNNAKSSGVNLKDFYAIYGSAMKIIETSIDLYQDILDLPNNVYGRFEKAYDTCMAIRSLPQAKNLKNALEKGKKLRGRFSSCTTAISNSGAFIKDIESINNEILELEAQRARIGDKSGEITRKILKKQEEKRQLEHLKIQAESAMKESQLTDLANRLDYIEESENEQYLKDMRRMQQQLNKATTDKEIAAATNALLYYNIQQQQKMYELQSKYLKVEVAEKQANLQPINDYQKQEIDTRSLQEIDSNFAEQVKKGKEVPKDPFGIPIMRKQ